MPAPEIFDWVRPGVLAKYPLIAFLLFFFASWFSQEGTMIGSAYMWKQGKVGWQVVYWGNVLGMSAGDLLLYYFGYRISFGLEKPWVRRFIKAETVEKGRVIYLKWGNWLTFMARFVPGLHIPGYTAGGLMRAPLGPFMAVVVLTAMVWVAGFMSLTHLLSGWQIFWSCLVFLVITRWVLQGFEDNGWKKRWLTIVNLFRSTPRE